MTLTSGLRYIDIYVCWVSETKSIKALTLRMSIQIICKFVNILTLQNPTGIKNHIATSKKYIQLFNYNRMDDQKEKYLQFPSNNRIYTNVIMVYRGTRINLKQKTGLLSDNYNNCNLNITRSKGTSLNKTVRQIQLKRYLSNSCKNGVETHKVINTTDGKTEIPAINTEVAITDHPKISYKDIYQLENLKLGLKRIKNSVIPGVDNILKKDITEKQLKELQKSLIKQSYQAKPSRRVTIKKPNGGNRQLGIASTNDKIIQSTLRILLEPILEKLFLDNSHGFRPKRGCHTALKDIKFK